MPPTRAFVEAVVDTSGAQAQMERELRQIISRVERGLPPVTIGVRLDDSMVRNQARDLGRDIDRALDDQTVRVRVETRESVDSTNRLGASLRSLGSSAASIAKIGSAIGAVGVAAAGSAQLIAGASAALLAIAPASAIAVSAIGSLALAFGTVRIALSGVAEALKTAFDPDADAEKLARVMANLAPAARAFVQQLADLKPAFDAVRLDVQERFFAGFAETMERLSRTVMPVFRGALVETADTLNNMALQVAVTAEQLNRSGVLGQALDSASSGLNNMAGIPALIVDGLTKIAVAAAPAFERITQGAANAATSISEKLNKAFESGALEEAISGSIELIKTLGAIVGDVFGVIKNLISATGASGEGFLSVLKSITQALQDATATEGFRDALGSLLSIMGTLGEAVAPLLKAAFDALLPVFSILGPPVEDLIRLLGPSLTQIVEALAPVLASLGGVFAAVIEAISPLLPILADLVSSLLPLLTPLLDAVAESFRLLAPFLEQAALTLQQVLTPAFDDLVPVLANDLLPALLEMSIQVLPALTDALVQVTPSLVQLTQYAVQLFVAITPLIALAIEAGAVFVGNLAGGIATVTSIIGPLIETATRFANAVLRAVVIPAIRAVAELLRGNFSSALASARQIVTNTAAIIVSTFGGLAGRARAALGAFAGTLRSVASSALNSMRSAISSGLSSAVSTIRGLPGRARSALGSLGSVLYGSGQSLIRGFINGIKSMIGAVASAASSVVSKVRDFFPFSPAKEGPFSGRGYTTYSGAALIEGFIEGMRRQTPQLQQEMNRILSTLAPSGGMPLSLANAGDAGMAMGSVGASALSQNSDLVLRQPASTTNVTVLISPDRIEEIAQVRIDRNNRARDRRTAQGVRR